MTRAIAHWSPDLDCWLESTDETQMGLFSAPPVVWSETWPTSGMTRDGSVYPLRAWEPHMNGGDSSSSPITTALTLLPSPRVSDTNGPGAHGDGGMDLRTAAVMLPTPEAGLGDHGGGSTETGGLLLPTPRATDGTKGGPNQRGSSGDLMLPSAVTHLLPTPTSSEIDTQASPQAWMEKTRKTVAAGLPAATLNLTEAVTFRRTKSDLTSEALDLLPTPVVNDMGEGNGNGHEKSLAIEAQRLLPTPTAGDAKQGYITTEQHEARAATKRAANPNLGDLHQDLPYIAQTTLEWGDYAAAIARWEHVLGRTAPAPTMTNTKGNPQLSPAFVEWLMGLPEGHVTAVPGVTRNESLRALGNGVCPQQAVEALRWLLVQG